MKSITPANKILTCITAVLLYAMQAGAQVGVGTTSPNSTLDVRGYFHSSVNTLFH